jgi:hypothetical protein|tara:strand:- start:992 stop:1390 length:399 start_codon:yes stop_codon:yes gene_type:complete
MNQTVYKIVKFTNGEEIICELSDEAIDGEYEIGFPLKMQIVSQPTQKGSIDSLNLSRWIGPYTEQSYFTIREHHILIIAEASVGLSRYYEHVMSQFESWDDPEVRNRLDEIDDSDVYDDLLKELEVTNKSIH